MKKVLFISILAVSLLILPTGVLAQGDQQVQQGQQGYGVQQQDRIQDPSAHEDETATSQGNQVQNQNRVVTQNQGEESQLQVATQHMEQLMDMEGLSEEVGQKLGAVAQQQVQAQNQIQSQLDKLKSRSKYVRALIGPNYKAIENIKRQIEQNQLRIQQLQQLQTEVANQADQSQIEGAIQALLEQNTALQERIQAEQQTGSLFGWLIRLFS